MHVFLCAHSAGVQELNIKRFPLVSNVCLRTAKPVVLTVRILKQEPVANHHAGFPQPNFVEGNTHVCHELSTSCTFMLLSSSLSGFTPPGNLLQAQTGCLLGHPVASVALLSPCREAMDGLGTTSTHQSMTGESFKQSAHLARCDTGTQVCPLIFVYLAYEHGAA